MTFVGFTPAMGTPDYMAPEQVQGKRGDERTDIYSLGAILYEMATGATLFEGENPYVVMNSRLTGDPPAPRKVNPRLTPVIEEIILHALERNPANRYASAGQMKAELDDYEKVPLTERWKHLQPPQIWKTRYRMVPIIAGLALLNVLLFLLLWWFLSHSKKHGHQSSSATVPALVTAWQPANTAAATAAAKTRSARALTIRALPGTALL
jgi:serine/threonine-protein kinase